MTELLIAALAGLGVGILSALFGVGGGILMVPFMVLVLDRGQHLAEGTSLLVILVTAIVGTIGHSRRNYVSFSWAGVMGLGGIGGAILGASIALGTSADLLRALFALLVVLSGVRLIRKGMSGRTGSSETVT
jgi:uncharacterized membrane protein YfcA